MPLNKNIIIARPGQVVSGPAVAVAIDVIRFCTTAAELCARKGSVHIGPASHPAIGRWRSLNPGGLVFAEQGGKKLAEADYDNSPFQAASVSLDKGPTLLCSSNGAPLALSLPAGRCWLASLVNISATAVLIRKLAIEENHPVLLFPASPGFEDHWCAEALRELAQNPDLSAQELLGDPQTVYHKLKEHSLRNEADLKLCAEVDRHPFKMRLEAKIDLNFGLIDTDNSLAKF